MNSYDIEKKEILRVVSGEIAKDAVIKEIKKINAIVTVKGLDKLSNDQLSRMAGKLSMLLINLGQECARRTADYNLAYSYRKMKYATQYGSLRAETESKIKDSELKAEQEIEQDRMREVERQYIADIYKTLYDDTSRLIGAIQSRLKIMGIEMKSIPSTNIGIQRN